MTVHTGRLVSPGDGITDMTSSAAAQAPPTVDPAGRAGNADSVADLTPAAGAPAAVPTPVPTN